VGDSQTAALILHWDGSSSSWSVVDRPSIGTYSTLWGVSAVAPNDIWAAGYSRSGAVVPLVMHWDGGSWSLASPSVSASNPWFSGIGAGLGGVWAVGTAPSGGLDRTLTARGPAQ
jgi:hypothetical protein